MVASGATIADVTKLEAGETIPSLLEGQPNQVLTRASRVLIFAEREDDTVNLQINLGSTNIFPTGPCTVNAANDTLPKVPDSQVNEVTGTAGDKILVSATNTSAAIKQIRILVFIFPIGLATPMQLNL